MHKPGDGYKLLKRQYLIGFLIRLIGYRFDKSWRQAETGFKAWFYIWSGGTVGCNLVAGLDDHI